MAQLKTMQSACTRMGVWAVIGTCFCIPLSTSLMDTCSGLVVLFWLLSGRALLLIRMVRHNPVLLLSSGLFLLFVTGVFFSPADLSYSLSVLMKYRELLLLPLAASLLADDERAVLRAENAFLAGTILLLLISFAMAFSLMPSAKYGNSLLFHITHSFFMAILSFWALQRALDAERERYFWFLVFAAATINIIFIAPGRTGMLAYAVLMFLALMQRISQKGRLAGCLLFFLMIPVGFFTSDNISSRVQQALQDIIHYEPGAARTSLGMRLDWWGNSLRLIDEKPVYGHGTGSFAVKQQELIKGTMTKPTDNPHNEYLFIGVQLGYSGLAVFIALLLSQWLCASAFAPQRRFLLQGVVLTMATGCMLNSFLFDSHQGHFYAFISALFFSSSTPYRLFTASTSSPTISR
jgi:O-antigen ligase